MKVTRKYFIRSRPDSRGRFVIHSENCPFGPDEDQRVNLGDFQSAEEILNSIGEKYGYQVFCPFCLREESKMRNQAGSGNVQVQDFVSSGQIAFSPLCIMFRSVS